MTPETRPAGGAHRVHGDAPESPCGQSSSCEKTDAGNPRERTDARPENPPAAGETVIGSLTLPAGCLVNRLFCRNPRCITSTEQELDHIFRPVDPARGLYRCLYCEQKALLEQK